VVFLQPASRGGDLGDVPDDEVVLPLGHASIARPGRDVTVVAIGSMVRLALKAAEVLAERGTSVEVIDPRTLFPLDKSSILASVARTHRLVIVDEARDTCSAASHVAAVVADEGFANLRAPIRRVTVQDLPIPYSPPLERAVIPDVDAVVAAVDAVVSYVP
jgi:pyruvate dehydrogenase E1 component beta subunit